MYMYIETIYYIIMTSFMEDVHILCNRTTLLYGKIWQIGQFMEKLVTPDIWETYYYNSNQFVEETTTTTTTTTDKQNYRKRQKKVKVQHRYHHNHHHHHHRNNKRCNVKKKMNIYLKNTPNYKLNYVKKINVY